MEVGADTKPIPAIELGRWVQTAGVQDVELK